MLDARGISGDKARRCAPVQRRLASALGFLVPQVLFASHQLDAWRSDLFCNEAVCQQYSVTLGAGPLWWSDVPHAAHSLSSVSTEGSGVGKPTGLSVSSAAKSVDEDELCRAAQAGRSLRLSFKVPLTEHTSVQWETVLWQRRLYVQIPSGLRPEGSKEGFVSLLEYAEDVLKCSHIIVCFKKDRKDRGLLVRTFMFLGFSTLAPGHGFIPSNTDSGNFYMIYAIE
ncbi:LOW QUALITY PROTEIN: ornithine decarboxylase antizyme 2 [Bacillus rossius redtenbacheri]|uniref:LOW QUALITY PROTEIN: ornithine decarboxylase antizyme 2 n=1 Tax=Bacillus rossius redtenbacheri TaxID=93214 RepID=UPI002FDD1FDE